jgi:hypothetical protein
MPTPVAANVFYLHTVPTRTDVTAGREGEGKIKPIIVGIIVLFKVSIQTTLKPHHRCHPAYPLAQHLHHSLPLQMLMPLHPQVPRHPLQVQMPCYPPPPVQVLRHHLPLQMQVPRHHLPLQVQVPRHHMHKLRDRECLKLRHSGVGVVDGAANAVSVPPIWSK